jgi:hypothetical protein
LVPSQSSWVQILADDVKVFEGILQPGDTKSFSGNGGSLFGPETAGELK